MVNLACVIRMHSEDIECNGSKGSHWLCFVFRQSICTEGEDVSGEVTGEG